MMRTRIKDYRNAALLLALAAASTTNAETTAMVDWLTFPELSVTGSELAYTGVTGLGYGWQAEITIDSGVVGRTKSWSVHPYVNPTSDFPGFELDQYAASRSYAVGKRPKGVHETVSRTFPAAAVTNFAVGVCNGNRDRLRAQGLSDGEIFGQEHQVAINVMPKFDVDVTTGKLTVEGMQQNPHYVTCLKQDLPQPPGSANTDVALPFSVTSAFLSIVPGHKTAMDCPAELSFIGRISTAGTGQATVQYRFEWPTGEKSTPFSVTVDGAQGADVAHEIPVPFQPASGGASPGVGGSAVFSGGFTPPPNAPGVARPEAQPSEPPAPSVEGASLPANEHKGDVRLVVLSQGGAVSQPAPYHVVCNTGGTQGFAGPAGVAAPSRPRAGDPDQPVVRGTLPNTGGDPDRPVVIGTVPNPPASQDDDARPANGGQAPMQPQQTDMEFLKAPAPQPDRVEIRGWDIEKKEDSPPAEEEKPRRDRRH